jgi:hypothetical protein
MAAAVGYSSLPVLLCINRRFRPICSRWWKQLRIDCVSNIYTIPILCVLAGAHRYWVQPGLRHVAEGVLHAVKP